MSARAAVRGLGAACGRSLFPLLALVVILGATWWGPWVSFLLAGLIWRLAAEFG